MFGKDAETSPELFPVFRSSFRGLELLDALEAQPLSAYAPSVSPATQRIVVIIIVIRHGADHNYCCHIHLVCSELLVDRERQREIERQTERERDRDRQRQTDREREATIKRLTIAHRRIQEY